MTPQATPLLDKVTIFRLTLDDFPLDQRDLDVLANPAERFRLEDALRETVSFEGVAAGALELWRERSGR